MKARLLATLNRLCACRRGNAPIEYGLMAALAASAITGGANTLGSNLAATFATIANALK
jgi:Flp pilus assembly pilin Flp